MASSYKNEAEEAMKTHHIIPFPAFDYHNEDIKPEDLIKILKGVLVSVTFTLWYATFCSSATSGKSEKNLERLNLGLACLMLAKPK